MLPDLASNWTTRPLREVCDLIMGQAPKGTTYNDKGIGTPLIAGAADLGHRTPRPKKWTTAPTKIGKQGDIILCVRATIGDLNWADKEYCYGRGVAGIRVNGQIDPAFVWYWLKACKEHLSSLGRGATFKQISKKDIGNLPIPDLDIAEQRRIVSQLRECMERVKEIEGLSTKCGDDIGALRQAVLCDIEKVLKTDAELRSIGSLIRVASGQFLPAKKMKKDGKYKVYGGNGITGMHDEFLFEKSVIVIGRVGAKCGCVYITTPKSWVTDNALYVKEEYEEFDQRYLAYMLESAQLRKYARQAAQPVISGKAIYSAEIPIVQIEKQRMIADTIDAALSVIDELTAQQVKRIKESTALRESILRKAFAGEL